MHQILQVLIVLGSDKCVFCILPDGLDCAELGCRGRKVQVLHPVVFLQVLFHLPVPVLACVVRYENLVLSRSVPEAVLVEPGRPQMHCASVHVCQIRGSLCRVALEYTQDHHHPVVDPDVPLCTQAFFSSRIFLLFPLMDGSAIHRSTGFSVIVHHEAKFSMSVTLVWFFVRMNQIRIYVTVFPFLYQKGSQFVGSSLSNTPTASIIFFSIVFLFGCLPFKTFRTASNNT